MEEDSERGQEEEASAEQKWRYKQLGEATDEGGGEGGQKQKGGGLRWRSGGMDEQLDGWRKGFRGGGIG